MEKDYATTRQKTEKRGKDAQEMFNILTLLLDEY
jgi:hypothetical protein